MLRTSIAILLVTIGVSSPALAAPILQQWVGTVQGFGGFAAHVPAGTPITVTLAYISESENLCSPFQPANMTGRRTSGNYALTGSISLLGGTLQGAGLIEVDSPDGNCTFPTSPTGVTFRVATPNGAPVGLPFSPLLWAIEGVYGVTPGGAPGAELWGSTTTLSCCRTGFGTISGTGTFQPIPEPATIVLVGTGLALSWRHRRRFQSRRK